MSKGRKAKSHFRKHPRLWKRVWILVGVFAVLGLVFGFYFFGNMKKDENAISTGNQSSEDAAEETWRKITYNGKTYRYNTRITTVLYMGIDTSERLDLATANGDAGQADSIMLMAYDRANGQISLIAIPRDTMADVKMYDMAGNLIGTSNQHINLAYAYGTGGSDSCNMMQEAVSNLMMDIPIDRYCAANLDSIGAINDLVGGVTVTVPEDDLEYLSSDFKKGNTLTLDSNTAEIFVRSRNINQSYSNSGRMVRQKVFLKALYERIAERLDSDLEELLNDIDSLNEYLVSNLKKSDLRNMAKAVSKGGFSDDNFHILEGENAQGANHDEFYVDQEKLMQLIVDTFYEEVEE